MSKQLTWNAKPLSYKRFIAWGLGLFIMAFGVAFAVDAALGVPPVTTLPYVVSRIAGISIGTGTYIAYVIYVLAELIIYRKNFRLNYILQIPCAFMFGFMTDFAKWCIRPLTESFHTIPFQILYLILGIVLLSFGLMLYLPAEIMAIPPDALAVAVSWAARKPLHFIKRICDLCFALTSFVIALVYSGGDIHYALNVVFIGTVISAIFVGYGLKLWNRLLRERVLRWMY